MYVSRTLFAKWDTGEPYYSGSNIGVARILSGVQFFASKKLTAFLVVALKRSKATK